MELALVDGQLANIITPASMMEVPGELLTSDFVRITGISDKMAHGQRFDENILASQLDQFIAPVALNAKFEADEDPSLLGEMHPDLHLPNQIARLGTLLKRRKASWQSTPRSDASFTASPERPRPYRPLSARYRASPERLAGALVFSGLIIGRRSPNHAWSAIRRAEAWKPGHPH